MYLVVTVFNAVVFDIINFVLTDEVGRTVGTEVKDDVEDISAVV